MSNPFDNILQNPLTRQNPVASMFGANTAQQVTQPSQGGNNQSSQPSNQAPDPRFASYNPTIRSNPVLKPYSSTPLPPPADVQVDPNHSIDIKSVLKPSDYADILSKAGSTAPQDTSALDKFSSQYGGAGKIGTIPGYNASQIPTDLTGGKSSAYVDNPDQVQAIVDSRGDNPYIQSVLSDLGGDIMKGKSLDQIRKAYPELSNIDDQTLSDLGGDIKKGATMDKIIQAYPELSNLSHPEDSTSTGHALKNAWNDLSVSHDTAKDTGSTAEVAGEFLHNVLASTINTVGAVANIGLHPINTIESVAKLGLGTAYEAGAKLISMVSGDSMDQVKAKVENMSPILGKFFNDASKGAEGVGDYFVQRYGSAEGFKNAAYTDPVGVFADIASILEGGASIVSKVAKVGGLSDVARISEDVAKGFGEVNPYTQTMKAGTDLIKGAKNAVIDGLSSVRNMAKGDSVAQEAAVSTENAAVKSTTPISDKLSNATKDQLEFARSDPYAQKSLEKILGNEDASPGGTQQGKQGIAALENPAKISLDTLKARTLQAIQGPLQSIVDHVKSLVNGLKDEGGRTYEPIRGDKTPISNPGAYYDALKTNYTQKGVVFNSNGDIVRVPENMNEKALTDIMDRAKNIRDNLGKEIQIGPNETTPNPLTHNAEALNHRDYLGQNSHFEQGVRSSDVANMYKDARRTFNKTIRPQVDGLGVADKNYKELTDQLEEMSQGLINSRSAEGDPLKNLDTMMIGKGNSSIKLMDKLKELYPEEYKQIQSIKNTVEMVKQSQKVGIAGKVIRVAVKGAAGIAGHFIAGTDGVLGSLILSSLEDHVSQPLIDRIQGGALKKAMEGLTVKEAKALKVLKKAKSTEEIAKQQAYLQSISDKVRLGLGLASKPIDLQRIQALNDNADQSTGN